MTVFGWIVGTVGLFYSNVEDGDNNTTNGCISADPRFERGFYLAAGSPCRDTGGGTAAAAGLAAYTTSADGSHSAEPGGTTRYHGSLWPAS